MIFLNIYNINEKNQSRKDAENVANFILVSNNAFLVKVENGDRCYLVLSCNCKHKSGFNYFKQLCDSFDDVTFYDNLLTFFIKSCITDFNVRDILMTESKQDLIEASRTSGIKPVFNGLRDLICSYTKSLMCLSYLAG